MIVINKLNKNHNKKFNLKAFKIYNTNKMLTINNLIIFIQIINNIKLLQKEKKIKI